MTIYPLLACRQRSQWRFLYTEIDHQNATSAQANIKSNNLQSHIRAVDTDLTGATIIPASSLEPFDRIDILMTNPPFYASEASLLESAKQKSRPPNSSCTGAPIEMITPGGEVAFVTKLILESSQAKLRRKIQWCSAMLGKLSSVAAVVEKLREHECTNFVVTEFIQGQKTRRWCVAWSWMGFRPSVAVARGIGTGSGVEKKFLPALTEMEFEVTDNAGQAVAERITIEIKQLDGVLWKFDPAKGVGMFMSRDGDVWSRKARRMKALRKPVNEPEDTAMKDHDHDSEDHEEPEPALVGRISIKAATATSAGGRNGHATIVHIRHLQGQDSVLFESFCGWLKRKLVLESSS
jgi:23S rRNA (adenine1618-N6)-methyltransferase